MGITHTEKISDSNSRSSSDLQSHYLYEWFSEVLTSMDTHDILFSKYKFITHAA